MKEIGGTLRMIKTGFIWDNKYLDHDVGDMKYSFNNGNEMGVSHEFGKSETRLCNKRNVEKDRHYRKDELLLPV